MHILSFDTSSSDVHVAVLKSGNVIAAEVLKESPGNTRQEAVAALMPSIVDVMAKANCDKSDLNCIVVGHGPGSFTGIRTAVVTARALGQAINIPVVPITLMDCYVSEYHLPSAIILDAGRGRFFAAAYESVKAGQFAIKGEPVSCVKEELSELFSSCAYWFCDQNALQQIGPTEHHQMECLPRVENIAAKQAQIAWNRLCLTDSDSGLLERFPYTSVLPLYLRNPSITLKKQDGN